MVRFGFRGSEPSGADLKNRKITRIIVLVVLGLALIGCERERISTINSDPGRFLHKDVVVAGTVTQAIGAFSHGIYQLDVRQQPRSPEAKAHASASAAASCRR
jgi:hypothetical protein